MPRRDEFADVLEPPPISFEIEGVVIPDNHSVYKLFPGKTYRLAKAMHETRHAFLDIQGLASLPLTPLEWDDETLLSVISLDRIMREGESHGKRRGKGRSRDQDKKRLRFLKGLFFEAKRGDLLLVPLGEGFSSQIAIGELEDEAGDIRIIEYTSNDDDYITYGRRVKWLSRVYRNQLSSELLKSIHSPTAFHVLKRSWHEEIYVSAYGTFTYDDIYVAKFQSEKETFSAQDWGNIGLLFNGFSVVHDHVAVSDQVDENFYELALSEESSATIELRRNSPLSVIVRTVGPLAFSAAVMFSGAAEGKSADQLQNVKVTARRVGDAGNKCKIEVPPDVAAAAIGLGKGHFDTFCRVRKRVEEEAMVKSPARLKNPNRPVK